MKPESVISAMNRNELFSSVLSSQGQIGRSQRLSLKDFGMANIKRTPLRRDDIELIAPAPSSIDRLIFCINSELQNLSWGRWGATNENGWILYITHTIIKERTFSCLAPVVDSIVLSKSLIKVPNGKIVLHSTSYAMPRR